MQYMVMIVGNADLVAAASPEDMQALMGAFMAYTKALKDAGVWVDGSPLKPAASAATLRIKDGKTQVLDGPYAESREQLGGYILIEVPDMETALAWAGKCPGLKYGPVEVREIQVIPGHNDRTG
ncbi:MAG: YciI family protein [Caulobacteraceae bacterium]